MVYGKGKAKRPERSPGSSTNPPTSSPPMQDSAKAHLEAVNATLTLQRRKSWFGSLRDAVQKGALQAKSAVDSWRVEPSTPQDVSENKENQIDDGSSGTHESPLSSKSTTPLRSSQSDHKTFGPKPDRPSLRRYLPGHTPRLKRSSSRDLLERPRTSASGDLMSDRSEQGHSSLRRRSSLANSLIGSIRGMGRRQTSSRPSFVARNASPEINAEEIPLPSSPIDIPSTAPALELDLGPSTLMSTSFSVSPPKKAVAITSNENASLPFFSAPFRSQFSKHLTNTDATDKMAEKDAATKGSLQVPECHCAASFTPATKANPWDTLFAMEIDGADDCPPGKRSQLFERSVTPTTHKERKEIRTMRSLDAMAEACAIAHAADDALMAAGKLYPHNAPPSRLHNSLPPNFWAPADSRRDAASNKERRMSSDSTAYSHEADIPQLHSRAAPRLRTSDDSNGKMYPTGLHRSRRLSSESTSYSTPNDMPPLSRVEAKDVTSVKVSAEPESSQGEEMQSNSAGFRETGSDTSNQAQFDYVELPMPWQQVDLPYRPKIDRQNNKGAEALFKMLNSAHTWDAKTTAHSPSEKVSQVNAVEAQDQCPDHVEAPSQSSKARAMSSEEDTRIRAQQLVYDNIVVPASSQITATTESPKSLLKIPCDSLSHNTDAGTTHSSPPVLHKSRSRTFGAGVGSEHVFSVDNWLKDSSNAGAPSEQPETPRVSMECSLYSVSPGGVRVTPQISPTTTNASGTPTMGSRVEFELKRSERNKLYNSLDQNEQSPEQPTTSTASKRKSLRFLIGGSDDAEAYKIRLSESESVNISPVGRVVQSNSLPQKPMESRATSEDSIAHSLKAAMSSNNLLREHLEDIKKDETPQNRFMASPALALTADEAELADILIARLVRSDTPSPEKNDPTQPTPSSVMSDLDLNATATPSRSGTRFKTTIRFTEPLPNRQTPSPRKTSKSDSNMHSSPPVPSSSTVLHSIEGTPTKAKAGKADRPSALPDNQQMCCCSPGQDSSPRSGYIADESSIGKISSPLAPQARTRYRSLRGKGARADDK